MKNWFEHCCSYKQEKGIAVTEAVVIKVLMCMNNINECLHKYQCHFERIMSELKMDDCIKLNK